MCGVVSCVFYVRNIKVIIIIISNDYGFIIRFALQTIKILNQWFETLWFDVAP